MHQPIVMRSLFALILSYLAAALTAIIVVILIASLGSANVSTVYREVALWMMPAIYAGQAWVLMRLLRLFARDIEYRYALLALVLAGVGYILGAAFEYYVVMTGGLVMAVVSLAFGVLTIRARHIVKTR